MAIVFIYTRHLHDRKFSFFKRAVFKVAHSQTVPIVTDGVAWSVCLSVGLSLSWALQNRLNRSRCRLGCVLAWVQGTMY